MVMAGSANAIQSRSAEVVFTHFGPIPEKGIRVADECYVPLDFLDKVGWKYSVHNTSVVIEGEGKTARVPLREFDLGRAVPLRMALDQIGADTFWEPDNDRLQVCSTVTKIVVKDGNVQIETALPTKPRVFRLAGPNRFVVDLPGTRLSRDTVQQLNATSTRVAQVELNTVRIAYEPGYRPSLPLIPGIGKSFKWQLDPDEDQGPIEVPPTDPPEDPVKTVTAPPTVPVETAKPPTAFAGPMTLDLESPNRAQMTLKITGTLPKPATFRRPEPDLLEIVLPNAQITAPDSATFSSASVTDISTRTEDGNGILALRLARPMGVELVANTGSLTISLIKPNVGNGKLAGKIIVVDAGHGGHDSGAKAVGGGTLEKTLTLKIAKQLSQKLADEGATVIMTRKTDVFIELTERAAIANRNKADIFISCHINSSSAKSKTTGTITFYHGQDAIGQVLADCIQSEIAKVSKLRSIGTWSDNRIYQSGFSVLRNSKMPCVLIEFGFINQSTDLKRMVTEDFQSSVAGAIVKGLKVYLGDGK
ncbi:MAG: hypothetical protein BGO01_06205 [Armatimonadetes bacterium 55-13]|nr:MAG: hypothetical protein BGO01_06205 [Armatimonadetes bacterium 55-13]